MIHYPPDKRRKPASERKSTQVVFLATEEFRDLLDRAAAAAGYSTRTGWMTQVLTRAASRVLSQKAAP